MSTEVLETLGNVICTRVGSHLQISIRGNVNDPEIQGVLSKTIAESIVDGEFEIALDLSTAATLHNSSLELLLDIQDALMHAGGALHLINCRTVVAECLYAVRITEYIRLIDPPPEIAEIINTEPRARNARIGDLLVESDLLTQAQVDEAILLQKRHGERLGAIIVKQEWAEEEDVLRVIALKVGVPFIRLRPGLFDPETLLLVDPAVQQRLKLVPIFKVRNTLFVATADPQHLPSIRELRDRLKLEIRVVAARSKDIAEILNDGSGVAEFATELVTDVDDDFEVVEFSAVSDLETIDEMASGSPVINLVNSIIQKAVVEGASDVHIEAFRNVSRIRFRIDGVLYEISNQRIDFHAPVVSRLKVMAGLDIAERRLPQDGRIQVNTQGRPVDLRFSSLPGLFGEKVVLRILDKRRAILDVNKLGMVDSNKELYLDLLTRSHGLILVTGPTGSGKTTTLYAGLNYLNSMEKSIVTIEDPVEYQMEIINQNEVRGNIGLGFAKILKHVLRQDPDIVMVGEIREKETAEIAVQAALTGHLVLSTLHTNDSIGAMTRMIDMGVEPYLLSSALIGVLAQRLIRTVCPACKTSYVAAPELAARHGWDDSTQIQLYKGRGCKDCFDSGYKGRMAIHEAIETSDEMQQLILANASRDELTSFVRDQEIRTLFDDGVARVREGRTTLEEVTRVVNH